MQSLVPPVLAPDPGQQALLAHDGGALLVTGPAGTGKTRILRERFAALVQEGTDPGRVALFTLSRRAAREARDKLVYAFGRSVGELAVFTAHSFAFRLLAARFRELDYPQPPQVLSAPEQYAAVSDLLAGADAADWPRFASLLGVASFQRQLADFVLRCQERLLDPDAVLQIVEASDREDHLEVARFYRRYIDALTQAGQLDFGGLLFQTVALLDRGAVPEPSFDHVMVDDYQDATNATEGIVTRLAAYARSVVLAADPAGHVFSFRGGSLEPLRRAAVAFPGVRRVSLEVDHRRGTGAGFLAPLEDPSLEPPAVAAVEARLYAHPGEEAEAVANELLRLRVDEDVAWGQMAVVVRRYGAYVTTLRQALARHGIPFLVVSEEGALAAEPAARPVIDLFRYVFYEDRRRDLLETVLGSSVGGVDPHDLRRLRREARLRGLSLLELVHEVDAEDLEPGLRSHLVAFRGLVDQVRRWADGGRPDEVFFNLWRELPYFREVVAVSERDDPEDEGGERTLGALSALAASLTRFSERRPEAGIEDYLGGLDAAEFGAEPWLPPEERRPSAVRLVSAHRAHGSEFEIVLVAGCLEGEFPTLTHGHPLVSLEALIAPASPSRRLAMRLAEERALFRLAVSRARRRTILFASGSSGARNPRTPSRYAARLGATWEPPREQASASASLRTMEGELRREMANAKASVAHRLSAAAALNEVGARPREWWGRRDWTDPGDPLYGGEIRTSYSRLSTLENCALQYLYQVELGLDDEETFQMWVGSAVHGIIDRVQRGELARDLPALHQALDDAWRPDIFPNRAIEHRRYLDARAMLARWVEHEQADAIASERWFEFPLDGAVIRGRIDAIFRMNNGHLRVVDYKTSRYPISEEEAKKDLQLAAYYLAMKRTPELAELGEPGYLQLDYLGKPSQSEGFARRGVSPKQEPGYEERATEAITSLVARIRAEEFGFNPEADCTFCSFRTICGRYPEGREAPVDATASRAGAPAVGAR